MTQTAEALPPNQPPTPPTPEAPTLVLPTPSPEVRINPNEDTFEQLERDAARRGREDMVGLEWTDEDGRLHRVSSYDRVTKPRKQPVKTRLPRFVMRSQIEGGPAIQRVTTDHVSNDEVIEQRTIDVFDANGDLVDVVVIQGKEPRLIHRERKFEGKIQKKIEKVRGVEQYETVDRFAEYFRVNSRNNPNAKGATTSKRPRRITNVRWGDQEPEATPPTEDVENIPVPLVDGRVSFYALAKQQRSLGREGWDGFAWTNEQGNKNLIVRDRVIITKDRLSGAEYPDRVLEVITLGEDDVVLHRQKYMLSGLQEHFDSRDRLYPNAPPVNPYWQMPKAQPEEDTPPTDPLARWYWEEERAWTNWAPPNRVETPPDYEQLLLFDAAGNPTEEATGPVEENHGTDISIDEAFMLLSYPELVHNQATQAAFEARLADIKNQPEMRQHAEALQAALAEVGLEKFHEIISGLHERYNTDLRRFGLTTPEDERRSTSWVIKALLDEQVNDSGNPFQDNEASKELREQVIDLRVGRRMREAFIKEERGQVPDWDGDEPTKRTIYQYKENPAMTGKLRALLYGKAIKTLLERQRTSDDPELTDRDFIHIGYMVGLSFGRS